ncbi:hypothetical protein Tsubulata_034106 [Turnera subulata]|uniref:Katanin p80 WD40 repeat-containing subunit B1 homolog n=1 Tax=Turnera subulata TaxID=218843 RepID=A0A9Q0G3N0_9ROSI|nr:hypothetical protein Tsubulata_034106 [Turnera subulata]
MVFLTKMETEEFVAHSKNVNCLSIGKKACRMFITGGDDYKVNLWAIGKPTSLMSLCGHTSPVESVAFDTSEVLVLAGASAGAIKLWDLEESKMVRTLTGHRSNCTAVEFHPFGEFFASGSMDANLRIWDIRKKGCIHTYKGHTRGVSTIRFTPDGRWVVSGGYDNVVKVWDLTAGKLLHDFKFHEGQIRSIDFHPLEFLLATGSADRTVKFWDLETFELIGSVRPEATSVRSISFHPDGRTLFCGLDDSLKVYSWEPVICHDAVDMGWSTLGDLCIHEEKILGCSYYQNSVGVWVADVSLIEPYGAGFIPQESESMDQNFSVPRDYSSNKVATGIRSTPGSRSRSPDYDAKEIKNIYVDSSGGNPVTLQRNRSLSVPTVFPSDSNGTGNLPTGKQSPILGAAKLSEQPLTKSFTVPTVVPRDNPIDKDSSKAGVETITFSKTKPGMLLRPAHIRRPSNAKNDLEKLSVSLESETVESEKETATEPSLRSQVVSEDGVQKSFEEKDSSIKIITEKFRKIFSPETPSDLDNCDESPDDNKGTAVKYVNGVAVVAGRTRILVEKFERREKLSNEDQATNMTPTTIPGMNKAQSMTANPSPTSMSEMNSRESSPPPTGLPEMNSIASSPSPTSEPDTNSTASNPPPITVPETNGRPTSATTMTPDVITDIDRSPIATSGVSPRVADNPRRTDVVMANMSTRPMPRKAKTPPISIHMPPRRVPERERNRSPPIAIYMTARDMDRTPPVVTNNAPDVIPVVEYPKMTPCIVREVDRASPGLKEDPEVSGRDLTSANDRDVIEDLMQTHDVFLNTLKSRLTKLQVVRHFWERNDIKGAINALRKLPDHSVQADVISVLTEKIEIVNLDLFSCLLPVLVGLLDSKVERHANVSLEMLLKLVAVFGPRIRSTISARPSVGVDLHAEQRRECCNQCFIQLQKIQQVLPTIIRQAFYVLLSSST